MKQAGNFLKTGSFLLFFLFFNRVFAQQTEEKKLNELSGYKYVHSVINADSSATGLPIIIGLHWSGSTPGEFSTFLTGITKPARLILVQAPYPHRSGFSFFIRQPKDYYQLPADEKMTILLEEGEKLSRFIEAITALYKPAIKPVIIGASQGGDLSYVMGIRYNGLISQSCPLLATMDNRIIITAKGSAEGIARIDAFHGTADPIVNIDTARQHIHLLKKNGFKAKLHTYKNITHDIPGSMKKDYSNLIDKILDKRD
jgi:phospholipase/carboxylesterase